MVNNTAKQIISVPVELNGRQVLAALRDARASMDDVLARSGQTTVKTKSPVLFDISDSFIELRWKVQEI